MVQFLCTLTEDEGSNNLIGNAYPGDDSMHIPANFHESQPGSK